MSSHSVRRIRRERGPNIAWSPRHDAYYVLAGLLPGASEIPGLALTQAAIVQVASLRRHGTSPVIFGLLAGNHCVDPRDKVDYLMVDEVVRARRSLSDDPMTELVTEIRSLATEVLRRDKLPIGWFLEGMADGGAPDPELLELHAKLFPEPWQFMLLCDDQSVGAKDVLIRIEHRSKRSYAIPFLELLPPPSGRGQTELRTALRWTNYITSQQVVPLAASHAVPASGSSSPNSQNVSARFASWLKTPFRRPSVLDGYRTPSTRSGSVAVPPSTSLAIPASALPRPAGDATSEKSKTPLPDAVPARSSSPPTTSQPEREPAKLRLPELDSPLSPPSTLEPSKLEPPIPELPKPERSRPEPHKLEPPSSSKEAVPGVEWTAPPVTPQPSVVTPATADRPESILPPAVAPASHEEPEPASIDEAGAGSAKRSTSPDVARVGGVPPDAPAPTLPASRPSNEAQTHHPTTLQSNEVQTPRPAAAAFAQGATRRAGPMRRTWMQRRNLLPAAIALTGALGAGWYLMRPASSQPARAGATSAAADYGEDAERAHLMQLESAARALVRIDGCSSIDACRTAPVGWRECGGPRLHLVYCAASTDTAALFRKLDELRQAEMTYNEKTGRTGNCDFRMPPPVALQSGGRCTESR